MLMGDAYKTQWQVCSNDRVAVQVCPPLHMLPLPPVTVDVPAGQSHCQQLDSGGTSLWPAGPAVRSILATNHSAWINRTSTAAQRLARLTMGRLPAPGPATLTLYQNADCQQPLVTLNATSEPATLQGVVGLKIQLGNHLPSGTQDMYLHQHYGYTLQVEANAKDGATVTLRSYVSPGQMLGQVQLLDVKRGACLGAQYNRKLIVVAALANSNLVAAAAYTVNWSD